ncbi:MAG: hypothetical protein WEB57_00050 [Pseudohongiellaceae bacterium]
MPKTTILDRIKFGTKARLIPVVADSKKEERATSVLLSSFMIVRQFADDVLSEVDGKVGVKAKLQCYTEVVFDTKEGRNIRPDGLVVITLGKKTWSALIEAKVGNAEHTKEQIESYLDLAKEVGADAVVTISNQFATKPTHHPIPVNKSKTRTTGLFHLSWLLILSKASVLSQAREIDDPEQGVILRELIRYLDHPSSGVSPMSSMNAGWKNVCANVQQNVPLKKTDDDVIMTASAWHQLIRYLSLRLSMQTGAEAQLSLKRTHAKDAEALMRDTIDEMISQHCLTGAISVPNTASDIRLTADLTRRVVMFSMKVNGNQEVVRPTAGINWLTRQLKTLDQPDLSIKAVWPGRTNDTHAPILEVIRDADKLVPEGQKEVPKEFEVQRVIDLGRKFSGQRVFVEQLAEVLPVFYSDVGERLSNWVAPPPRTLKKEEKDNKKEFPDEIDNRDNVDEEAQSNPRPAGILSFFTERSSDDQKE